MTEPLTKAEEDLVDSVGDSLMGGSPVAEPDSEEPTKFDFDEQFQWKIAALLMRDLRFARRTAGLVKPEYFDNEYIGFLVDCSQAYFQKYNVLASEVSIFIEVLKDNFARRKVRNDMRSEIVEAYKKLRKVSLTDSDYIAEKIGTFARHQAIQAATIQLIELSEKGDYDRGQEIMEKAFRVGVTNEFEDIDFAESVEARAARRKEIAAGTIKKTGISTGYKKIDKLLLHDGWGRKELSVLMGGAKKGKSMGLGQFAINAYRKGYNVLYVTCEVSTEIIQDRMDANISHIPIGELTNRINEAQRSVESITKSTSVGKLKIVETPSGTLTPAGLRRMIERYRGEGILFDLIVVDYADIMAPDRFTYDAIENSKNVWLGLRAIAHEENAAVLTATQTNRQGFKAETAKAEDVAEDFNKIRIADLIISINRTDEERDRGEARLYFAASRNQGGEFSIPIKQDLETMRFITAVGAIT